MGRENEGRRPVPAPVTDKAVTQTSDFVERYRVLEEERNRYRAALLSLQKILRQVQAVR